MNKKGFTLIELLVVIAIIGLLSTLAVVALGSARVKARDAKRLSDLRQIQNALELFYTENNNYPTAAIAVVLGGLNTKCLDNTGWVSLTACAANPHMGVVPADPEGNEYSYISADGTTYSVNAELEGKVNDLDDTIRLTPSGIIDTDPT